MIWADRAGLGLWAIGMIAIGLMLCGGLFGPITVSASQPAEFVLPSQNPFADLDQAAGIEPPITALYRAADGALRLTAFAALPAWLNFRIVDFVFGGPMRRKTRRQAGSRLPASDG